MFGSLNVRSIKLAVHPSTSRSEPNQDNVWAHCVGGLWPKNWVGIRGRPDLDKHQQNIVN